MKGLFGPDFKNGSGEQNTENTILMFNENCFCLLNLVFYVLFVFSKTKKNGELNAFSLFLNRKLFSKTGTKQAL